MGARILPAFFRRTQSAAPEDYEDGDEHEARNYHRRVAPYDVWSRTGVALSLAREDALHELRELGEDFAASVDDRGHARVGRAQHVPPGLERAHARDLQVLAGSERVAEPRDVRHVEEQRRIGKLADDLLAECILPADVRRHLLPGEG